MLISNYLYDYLVVGAGPFGATFARKVTDAGKKCLVIDRRNHIAGNCYTESRDGIDVHIYGPHIFHTNNEKIWRFVNRFGAFFPYRHRVLARSGGRLFTLPFSLQTLHEFFGQTDPENLMKALSKQRCRFDSPCNMEEQALSLVGAKIYKTLIEGYSEKQWGKHPGELPVSILRRLPFRESFITDYFDDRYQGIPEGGYTGLFKSMLKGIEVRLGIDYLENKERLNQLAKKIVYTGAIDELYGEDEGRLEWRCLEFQHERLQTNNFQGTSVMNYPEKGVPWVRITEHRHFLPVARESNGTWITKEFSHGSGYERAYPVETGRNRELYRTYQKRAHADGYILGGRLAQYRYYDMHQVIASALQKAGQQLGTV